MKPIFGACGIYCELCRLYHDAKCEGCSKRNEWYKPACRLFSCSTSKGLECCLECKEFPCETHYRENMVYTKESLNTWKEMMSKPREYFIQIKKQELKKKR